MRRRTVLVPDDWQEPQSVEQRARFNRLPPGTRAHVAGRAYRLYETTTADRFRCWNAAIREVAITTRRLEAWQ